MLPRNIVGILQAQVRVTLVGLLLPVNKKHHYQADIHWYPSLGSHLANPSQVLTNGRMTATSQEYAVFDSATIAGDRLS